MDLVGREHELTEIAARLDRGSRLVTLVGPGGVGKTTLARAALDTAARGYPLGAHVVDLGRIDRGDAVGGALAAQLGFGSFDALLSSPTEAAALVLVDNCEHVLDAAARSIEVVLERCASPTILATSRSPLGIAGETVIAVPPLAVDVGPAAATGEVGPTSPALALLLRRSHDAGVDLGPDDLASADDLCRRLDGLPLAIEIAAARTRTLTVAEIVRLLDTGIDVIARPRFRGDPRHRSLRDTIRWSYDLLDEEAQHALDRLGACAGPFTLDAAAAIALDAPATPEEALAVVERLVDASLLTTQRTPRGTRYRMLDTVRAGAAEHLAERGETAAVRSRLSDHVAGAVLTTLAESAERWDADLLPTMLDLYDAVDAAIRHCVAADDRPGRAFLLYGALWSTVHQSRADAIIELGDLVLARWPDVAHARGADVAATLSTAHLLEGHVEVAVRIATEALDDAAPGSLATITLRRTLALAARARGDSEGAIALFGEAATLAAAHGLPALSMECRTFHAQELAAAGRADEALAEVREVAAGAVAARSVINEIWARTVEAAVLRQLGDAAARDVAAAALSRSVAIEYPFGIVSNERTLALDAIERGHVDEAAERARRLLDAVGRSGPGDLRVALDVAVAVLHAAGVDDWRDLAATAGSLPDTNPISTLAPPEGVPELAEGAPRALVLDRSAAIQVARRALTAVSPTAPPTEPAPEGGRREVGPASPSLARLGDVWRVAYDGAEVVVRHAKGIEDLARLLESPRREVHCLDLAGAGVDERSVGATLDETARRAYEQRVRDLQDELDAAEAAHDIGRADAARVELDAVVDQLTSALGLGGRGRTTGTTAARARSAVTHRIRSAIRRIGQVHPALGAHLGRSVRTGTWCRYEPDTPVDWTIDRTTTAH